MNKQELKQMGKQVVNELAVTVVAAGTITYLAILATMVVTKSKKVEVEYKNGKLVINKAS